MPDYYQTFFRNYDQALGRFISIDPLTEIEESLTGYNYAGNNPVMFNDPLGDSKLRRMPEDDIPEQSDNRRYLLGRGDDGGFFRSIGQPVGAAAAQNNAAAIGSARGRYFLHNLVNDLLDSQFGGEWTSSEGTGYYANLQTALDQGSAAVSHYEKWTPAYAQLQYSLFAANINMSANAGINGYTHVKTTLNQTDDFDLDFANLLDQVEIHSTVIGYGIKHGWVGRNELMWSGGELNSMATTQLYFALGEIGGPFLGRGLGWTGKKLLSRFANTRMTDLQLVTRAAQKAETAIGGTGRFAGTAKHTYANNLLSRYQSIYGSRGFRV